jgi:hypothetical protein
MGHGQGVYIYPSEPRVSGFCFPHSGKHELGTLLDFQHFTTPAVHERPLVCTTLIFSKPDTRQLEFSSLVQ